MRKTEDKADERGDELLALVEAVSKKQAKDGSVDEMSLESRRRAIVYGRARGNS